MLSHDNGGSLFRNIVSGDERICWRFYISPSPSPQSHLHFSRYQDLEAIELSSAFICLSFTHSSRSISSSSTLPSLRFPLKQFPVGPFLLCSWITSKTPMCSHSNCVYCAYGYEHSSTFYRAASQLCKRAVSQRGRISMFWIKSNRFRRESIYSGYR